MFKKWSLSQKLMASFTVASLVSVGVGAFSYVGLQNVTEDFLQITSGDLPRTNHLGDMRVHAMAVARNMALIANPDISSELRKEYEEKLKIRIEAFEKSHLELKAIGFTKESNKQLMESISQTWHKMKDEAMEIDKLAQGDIHKNEPAILKILTVDFEKEMDDFTKEVKELEAGVDASAKANVEKAHKAEIQTDLLNLATVILGALGLMLFGFFFSRSLTGTINTVVLNLSESANQITSASAQVASSSEELSQAATEQAASLEETAASLEEISSMVTKASESANQTASSSVDSQQKAEQGKSSADQMLNSMNEISQSNEAIMNQVNHSNDQMKEVVKVIQEIGNKTKVINDIVFQTKLLSFNASVEAARAGEHGKGFAVVAEEVGNLAQMSGNAAKEISDMLTGSIAKVEDIVQETQRKVETLVTQGKQRVESGVGVAKQCSEVLGEIVQSASTVSSLAQEISNASKEQSQGVSEINKAVAQLDSVTQQNAATSEETASAAEQLSAQAECLNAAVRELVLTIQGDKGTTTAPTARTTEPVKSSAPKPTSNIVHIKAAKKANHFSNGATTTKAAVGDGTTPDRNHAGFRDV